MLEQMKTTKTKHKKKSWFTESFQNIKRKFTMRKEKAMEGAVEQEDEGEEEEFTIFDSRGDPVPEGDG